VHIGRYGRDSESGRISQLFLGYPWLIRGYDAESFTIEECETGDCEEFTQLFGSRMALGNFELRLPLFGAIGLVRSPGVPPIEATGFFDVGAAWTDGENARFLGGSRPAVSSYGTSLRVNLLGFAVAEVAYVHPNDRPRKGWYWQFMLQPGF
jgi:outer membrane protein assembly factor BamA